MVFEPIAKATDLTIFVICKTGRKGDCIQYLYGIIHILSSNSYYIISAHNQCICTF